MTAKTFKFQFVLVIVLLFASCGLATSLTFLYPQYIEQVKLVPTVLVPVAAAWLAFCWQRRVSFTKALSDIWQKTVGTIQDTIQYTHLTQPNHGDFAKISRDLSCRIEDIRGAFRNVDERSVPIPDHAKNFVLGVKLSANLTEMARLLKNYTPPPPEIIGVYPFESLKQILTIIDRLGYDDAFNQADAKVARRTIMTLWQILRTELLKELDRDFPEYPDTPYRQNKQLYKQSKAPQGASAAPPAE